MTCFTLEKKTELLRQPKKCEYLVSNGLSDGNVTGSLGDDTIELITTKKRTSIELP